MLNQRAMETTRTLFGSAPAAAYPILTDVQIPESRPAAREAIDGTADSPIFTELVTQIETLERLETPWRALETRSLVVNPNYGPDAFLPTFRHFAETSNIAGCILVWKDDGPGDGMRLVGFLPCRRPRFRWGLPIRTLTNWALPHMALGVPLLDRDCAQEALAAMLAHARALAGPAGLLILEEIDGAGAFHEVLQQALTAARTPSATPFTFERAAFVPEDDFQTYQQKHYKSKTRQTYRRKRKKLTQLGRLETVFLETWQEIEPELDAFLALEGSGWKRRSGSALICDPTWQAWYRDVVRTAAEAGNCLFAALKLEGRMLAAAVVDIRETTAELGKIAYDESFARFSPGGLLTLDLLEEISRRPALRLFDSAARPDNDTLYAQFKQRRAIEHRVIGLLPDMPAWRFAPLARLETLRRRAAPRIRTAMHALGIS